MVTLFLFILQADSQCASKIYYCRRCHDQYIEFTDSEQLWIGCSSEGCDAWYHFVCVGLDPDEPAPDTFFCDTCVEM